MKSVMNKDVQLNHSKSGAAGGPNNKVFEFQSFIDEQRQNQTIKKIEEEAEFKEQQDNPLTLDLNKVNQETQNNGQMGPHRNPTSTQHLVTDAFYSKLPNGYVQSKKSIFFLQSKTIKCQLSKDTQDQNEKALLSPQNIQQFVNKNDGNIVAGTASSTLQQPTQSTQGIPPPILQGFSPSHSITSPMARKQKFNALMNPKFLNQREILLSALRKNETRSQHQSPANKINQASAHSPKNKLSPLQQPKLIKPIHQTNLKFSQDQTLSLIFDKPIASSTALYDTNRNSKLNKSDQKNKQQSLLKLSLSKAKLNQDLQEQVGEPNQKTLLAQKSPIRHVDNSNSYNKPRLFKSSNKDLIESANESSIKLRPKLETSNYESVNNINLIKIEMKLDKQIKSPPQTAPNQGFYHKRNSMDQNRHSEYRVLSPSRTTSNLIDVQDGQNHDKDIRKDRDSDVPDSSKINRLIKSRKFEDIKERNQELFSIFQGPSTNSNNSNHLPYRNNSQIQNSFAFASFSTPNLLITKKQEFQQSLSGMTNLRKISGSQAKRQIDKAQMLLQNNADIQKRINLYENKSRSEFAGPQEETKQQQIRNEVYFNIVGKSMTKKDERAHDAALLELALKKGQHHQDFKYYLQYSGFSKTARFYQ
ncbi:UNKNOWN [Stylonychia lemnae]|uniref:Uncharacterized protein n=1 Tax=Stylonychia lemnae TaxID=5949 RepID=A0A077ZUV4_STYLE|nr:UNKNOWN [Stylonychia lemnae]|eukprot:CDW73085.1 UNKNOWN [Stylonychia lemnae]